MSCEYEKDTCSGTSVADGLNTYFACDSGWCDWKFNLKSDKCVKVFGSRWNTKPNDQNKEWFKQGKKIEFTYGYENCDQKKPFHVSIVPCEDEGDYDLSWNITEIPCGISNFTFDLDFTQQVLKMQEKVTFERGTFTDVHCDASHGKKVVYTVGQNKNSSLALPESESRAECESGECKIDVNVGGLMGNQAKSAYIWAWYDGKVGNMTNGKVA